MLDVSVYRTRLQQIGKQIDVTNADFALLTPSPNFQYIAGYNYEMRERLVALLISKNIEPTLIVPAFEESDHASKTWIKNILTWEEDENPFKLITEAMGRKDHNPIALFDDTLPLGIYWSLEKAFGGFKSSLSLTPTILAQRLVKSESELVLMRKAGQAIDKAVMSAFKLAELGMTEVQLQQKVHEEIIRHGAIPTFAAIQFGKNSALPHASPSTRELARGDVLLMDCGCSIDGYNTDMTRIGVVGESSEEIDLVYSLVRKAEETAIEKISKGMTCGAADGIARRVIEESGYGDYFTHRLGHGIGLEVHEAPYLVRGSPLELGLGMCHSIEPGVYLEGKFGIRIEDLVCIRDDSLEVLTYSPKDLIVLDL